MRAQTMYARTDVSLQYGFAKHSERFLRCLHDPQTNQIRALSGGSSNVIRSFIASIDTDESLT